MLFLIFALAVLAAFVAVLLINTTLKRIAARKLEGTHPVFTEDELATYGLRLQKMLSCKTVSVKGSYDDTEFAKLRTIVETEFPLLHEKAERFIFSQDCWIYKIPGKNPSRNIMLMSHHDVVDADDDWTQDAFNGHIEDGKIYGRGAADTKGSLCAILCAAEQMLSEGFEPEVNVWIGSSHNEELGGDGIPSALAWFREQGITFEVILDEGGAIVDPPLGKMKCEKCAMVAVHEKGRCRVNLTASWESSHVSLTGYKNNPVERMAGFIREISSKNIFITRFNPQVEEMFSQLAPYCGFPMNVLFSNLWCFAGLIRKALPKINATAGGMIGTTCAFRNIQGSTDEKCCKASAMLRNIDETDLTRDLETFKNIAKKFGIEVEVEYQEYYGPADMEALAYRYTMECLHKIFPKYPAAPYILPAGTDAWKLTPICGCVLRFAPTRMSAKQLASIHAADENIDVSAIAEAAVFYRYFVRNYQ